MNLSKLRRIHIIIIGLVIEILLGVGLYMLLIKPANEELQKETDRYNAAYPDSTDDKRAMAERKMQDAKMQVAKTEAQFNTALDQKMPNLRFDQRDKGMLQLWHEQVEVLGPLIERYVRKSGVTMLSDIKIPPPPVNPNDPLFQQDYFTVPIGTIQVQGNFKGILDHIRKWNSFNRLVQVDLPSLEGPSPTLTSSYNLTVYIFPRKTAQGAPQITIAGAPGANNAGGGGAVTVGVPPPMMPGGGAGAGVMGGQMPGGGAGAGVMGGQMPGASGPMGSV